MGISVKVYGKVNLALNIQGVQADGYHILDTVMTNVSCCDEVFATKRQDKTVNVTYKKGENFKNDIALRAGIAAVETYGVNGADIYITKGIPEAAGLGGSSACAAGVVKCMEELYGFKADMGFLLSLGSDVPYMYGGGFKRVRGIGGQISNIDANPPKIVVVCDNRLQVNTAKCYKLYDLIGGGHILIDDFLLGFKNPKNSLERAATQIDARIAELKNLIYEAGFANVVLSGSGGALIAWDGDETALERLNGRLEGLNTVKIFN